MHLDPEKSVTDHDHHHDHDGECSHGCHHHDHGHDHEHDHNHHHSHDHDHCDHSHSHDLCPEPKQGKKGILLTAFGCALPHTHHLYEKFEEEVRTNHPDISVRWAFTANRIRAKLNSRGIRSLSVAEALSAMIDDGFSHVAVQSIHTLPGVEYDWVVQQAESACHPRKGLTKVSIGAPLLNRMEDLEHTVEALYDYIPAERKENEGVILIGHGTYHNGHTSYMALEGLLARSLPNVAVGTLMDREGPAELGRLFTKSGIKKVYLVPFMCVPGHHVEVDLFGKGGSSWAGILAGMDIEIIPVTKGSLEHKGFRDIWHDHLEEAMEKL